MKKNLPKITDAEISKIRDKIDSLSNTGKYKQVYILAKSLCKKYPDVLLFQYYEAVFIAEDTRGLTTAQINANYKKAAKKLRKLTQKLKGANPNFIAVVRNEYYWFSKQHYKQYLLGVERVKKGNKSGYYSQGVGASRIALKYGRQGKMKLCQKWAQISEKAWLNYFIIYPDWFNAYYFYAVALGLQGKEKEMHKALTKGSKISGISIKNEIFQEAIEEVKSVLK